MSSPKLSLRLLEGRFSVCCLPDGEAVPSWVMSTAGFSSVTRTAEELSIVCPQDAVPEGIRCETGFRALQVAGPLDFGLTGILASLATPLAEAGISIFALSTYDTDYVFVREASLPSAIQALTAAGHQIT